jgi:PAS domain S-box-containing protein
MNGYPTYPSSRGAFAQQQGNADSIMDLTGGDMDAAFAMGHGQSLDDIVSSNDKADRRRSMPVYAGNQMHLDGPDARRFSSMNFGGPGNAAMDDFQFDMSAAGMDAMLPSAAFPRSTAELQNDRAPASDLAINTQFSQPNPNSPFHAGSAYASPLQHNGSLDMDLSPYPNGLPMQLDMNDPMAMLPNDMNMFPNNAFSPAMMNSPSAQDFGGPPTSAPQDTSRGMASPAHFRSESSNVSTKRAGSQLESRPRSTSRSNSHNAHHPSQNATDMSKQSLTNQQPIQVHPEHQIPQQRYEEALYTKNNLPWATPPGGFPSTKDRNPHQKTQFKNAYSSTGFDMLGVLMRVATRPNPRINIGSVDLSCAFVVCDAEMDDIPIVYCSENFERLTGYSKHMILGRNCRFLQSPDGKVEPGIKRRYVDDDSVLYLKTTITDRAEAQISLINYRRGGQPFMNLLTMIPIAWEPGGNTKFYVGFQVDLVEQPHSMTNKNPDGSYRVNYQRGMSMPSYVFTDHKALPEQQGTTISKDEVSSVLAAYGSTGDSEITRRLWDKVLLENTDDVVHVLSLKGLFLYLSPSSNQVLEYDPSELVGTALSSVCHPSDIVPVTRELKETSSGASVNVVFRIRRKKSGYMWFEGHGSLHTEQGKGRKCIILVGRERPVYTLSKTVLRASGGIGENELWAKLSTSGMFLFVSANVRSLLDRQPEELVGTSIQALMRQESKQQFGKILELARTGRKGEVKHEVINKRGQVLQAFTTVYPGDATAGHKPTFLVGQIRLLKYSRNAHSQRPALYQSRARGSDESGMSLASTTTATSHQPSLSGSTTPQTNTGEFRYTTTEEQATTFSGSNGLTLGHQDQSLASEDNVFDELKTTRSTSWQFELRQMEKRNRYLAEEVQSLLAAKKKRKRRKGAGQLQKDCANCHTRTTPEWRRGPSGNRDLCNSCGLRWAKQVSHLRVLFHGSKLTYFLTARPCLSENFVGAICCQRQEQEERISAARTEQPPERPRRPSIILQSFHQRAIRQQLQPARRQSRTHGRRLITSIQHEPRDEHTAQDRGGHRTRLEPWPEERLLFLSNDRSLETFYSSIHTQRYPLLRACARLAISLSCISHLRFSLHFCTGVHSRITADTIGCWDLGFMFPSFRTGGLDGMGRAGQSAKVYIGGELFVEGVVSDWLSVYLSCTYFCLSFRWLRGVG